MSGCSWLIELVVDSRSVGYYSKNGFCDNANHAARFASKREAEEKIDRIKGSNTWINTLVAVEHKWMDPKETQP